MSAMSRTLRRSFATLAAAASLQALLPGGDALAQGVRMFEEAPSLEVLRNIIIPESRPGLSRRIVITNPDRPAPSMAPAPVAYSEPAPEAPAPRWSQPSQPQESWPSPPSRRPLPLRRPPGRRPMSSATSASPARRPQKCGSATPARPLTRPWRCGWL